MSSIRICGIIEFFFISQGLLCSQISLNSLLKPGFLVVSLSKNILVVHDTGLVSNVLRT
jgi:hypothetical protein